MRAWASGSGRALESLLSGARGPGGGAAAGPRGTRPAPGPAGEAVWRVLTVCGVGPRHTATGPRFRRVAKRNEQNES